MNDPLKPSLRPERAFLLLGLVFGLVFMALTPPFQANDEWNHFFRAYQISEGRWLAERNGQEMPGGKIPKSMLITAIALFHDIPYTKANMPIINARLASGGLGDDVMNPFKSGNKSRRAATILSLFKVPPKPEERVFIYFMRTAVYTNVSYLPQAAGIALGRMANLAPVGLIYSGRMGNFIVWLLLTFLAIRTTPISKWAIAILALVPASVFMGIALSLDGPSNAMAFLLVALVLRLAYDDIDPRRYDIVVFLVLSALMGFTKFYVFLPLTLLLVPRDRITPKVTIGLATVGVTLAAGLAWAWMAFSKQYFIEGFDTGVSPDKQLEGIMSAPLEFVAVLWRTVIKFGPLMLKEFTGRLGHFGLMMPGWALAAAWTLLLAASLLDRGMRGPGICGRALLTGLAVASIVPVMASSYMAWTPVGHHVITGLQGRYLMPVAPLLIMALFIPKKNALVPGLIWASAACVLLLVGSTTLLRGYFL